MALSSVDAAIISTKLVTLAAKTNTNELCSKVRAEAAFIETNLLDVRPTPSPCVENQIQICSSGLVHPEDAAGSNSDFQVIEAATMSSEQSNQCENISCQKAIGVDQSAVGCVMRVLVPGSSEGKNPSSDVSCTLSFMHTDALPGAVVINSHDILSDCSTIPPNSTENRTESSNSSPGKVNIKSINSTKPNSVDAELSHVSEPSKQESTLTNNHNVLHQFEAFPSQNHAGSDSEDKSKLPKSEDVIGMAVENSLSVSVVSMNNMLEEVDTLSKSLPDGSSVDNNDIVCSSVLKSHLAVNNTIESTDRVLDSLDMSIGHLSCKSLLTDEIKAAGQLQRAHKVSDNWSCNTQAALSLVNNSESCEDLGPNKVLSELNNDGNSSNDGAMKTVSEHCPRLSSVVNTEKVAKEATRTGCSTTKSTRNCSIRKGKKVLQHMKSGSGLSDFDSSPAASCNKAPVEDLVSDFEIKVPKHCETEERWDVSSMHDSNSSEHTTSKKSYENLTSEDASIELIGQLNANDCMPLACKSLTDNVTPLGMIMQLVADMGSNLNLAIQKRPVFSVAENTSVKLLKPVSDQVLESRPEAWKDGDQFNDVSSSLIKPAIKRNKIDGMKLNKLKSAADEAILNLNLCKMEPSACDVFKQKKNNKSTSKVKPNACTQKETARSRKPKRGKNEGIIISDFTGCDNLKECDSIVTASKQVNCIVSVGCEAGNIKGSVERKKVKGNRSNKNITIVEDEVSHNKQPKGSKRKTLKLKKAEAQSDDVLTASISDTNSQENAQNCDTKGQKSKKCSPPQRSEKCAKIVDKADPGKTLIVESAICSLEVDMFPTVPKVNPGKANKIKRAGSSKKKRSSMNAAVDINAQVPERTRDSSDVGTVKELAVALSSPTISEVENDTSGVNCCASVQKKPKRKRKNVNSDGKKSDVDDMPKHVVLEQEVNQAAVNQMKNVNEAASYQGDSMVNMAPFTSSPVVIVSGLVEAKKVSLSHNSTINSTDKFEQKESKLGKVRGDFLCGSQSETIDGEFSLPSNLVLQQHSSLIDENSPAIPIKTNKRKRNSSKVKASCAGTNLGLTEIPQIETSLVSHERTEKICPAVEKNKRCRKKMKTQDIVLVTCSEKINSAEAVCLALEGCHKESVDNVDCENIKGLESTLETETALSASIKKIDQFGSDVTGDFSQTRKGKKPSKTCLQNKGARNLGMKSSSATVDSLTAESVEEAVEVSSSNPILLSECLMDVKSVSVSNIGIKRVTDEQMSAVIKNVAEGSSLTQIVSDGVNGLTEKKKKKKNRKKQLRVSACVEDLLITDLESSDKISSVVDSVSEKQFTCPSCSYKSNKKGQLRKHLSVHCVFACAHCAFIGNSHDELDEHMNVVHPSRCGRRLCKRCHMLFRTDDGSFIEHERSCTGDKFTWCCSFCSKQFKFVSAMKTHVRRWHANQTPKEELAVLKEMDSATTTCDKSGSDENLTTSVEVVPINPEQCNLSEKEKVSETRTNMAFTQLCNDHTVAKILAEAADEKGILTCIPTEIDQRFQCTQCEKTFKARRSMVHHRRMIHEGGRLLKRHKTLPQPIGDDAHMPISDNTHMPVSDCRAENSQLQSQSSENVFTTDGSESSKTTSVLSTELLSSNGIQLVVDSKSTPSLLTVDKDDSSCDKFSDGNQGSNPHTDERSVPQERRTSAFVCKFLGCHHTFKRPGQLHRHEEKHASPDEKTFRCDWPDCRKRFLHVQNMHSHRRQHVDPKPYRCGQCSLAYWQKSSLRNHESKAHGNVTDISQSVVSLDNEEKLIESTCTEVQGPSLFVSNNNEQINSIVSNSERDISIEECKETGKGLTHCSLEIVREATAPIVSESKESIHTCTALEKVALGASCDDSQKDNSALQKSVKRVKRKRLSKDEMAKRSATPESLEVCSDVKNNSVESRMNTSNLSIQGSETSCQRSVSTADAASKADESLTIESHTAKPSNVYEFCEEETVDIPALKACRGVASLRPTKPPTSDEVNRDVEQNICGYNIDDRTVSKLKKRKLCKNQKAQNISTRSEHKMKSVCDANLVSDYLVSTEDVRNENFVELSSINEKVSQEVDGSTVVAPSLSKCKSIRKKGLKQNLLNKKVVSGRFSNENDSERLSKLQGRRCFIPQKVKKGNQRRNQASVENVISSICIENVISRRKSSIKQNKNEKKVKPKPVKLQQHISKADSKKYLTAHTTQKSKILKGMRIKKGESRIFVETRSKTRFLIAEAEKQIASAIENRVGTRRATRKSKDVCEKSNIEVCRPKKKFAGLVGPKKSVSVPVVSLSVIESRLRKDNRKQVTATVTVTNSRKMRCTKDKKPKCHFKKSKLLESYEMKPCSVVFDMRGDICVGVLREESKEIIGESLNESCPNADKVPPINSPNTESTSDQKQVMVHTNIVVSCESDRQMQSECETCESHEDMMPPAPTSPEPIPEIDDRVSPASPTQINSLKSEVSDHVSCSSLQNQLSEESSHEEPDQTSEPFLQEPKSTSSLVSCEPNGEDINLEPELSNDKVGTTMASQENIFSSGVNENASVSCSSSVSENCSLSRSSFQVPVQPGGSCLPIEAARSISFVDMVHQAALPDTSMDLYHSNAISPVRGPSSDPNAVLLDRAATIYQDLPTPAYPTSYSSVPVRSDRHSIEELSSDRSQYGTGSCLPSTYFDSTAFISRSLPDTSLPSYGTQLPSYAIDQQSQLSKASSYLPYGAGSTNPTLNNTQLVREAPVYVPPAAAFPSDAFAKDLFGQYFPEASLPVHSSLQDQRAAGNIIGGYQQTSMTPGGMHPNETTSDLFRRAYSGGDNFPGSKSASVSSSQPNHYWMPSSNVDGRHHNPSSPQLVPQGNVDIARNSYASVGERTGSAEPVGRIPPKRMEVGQSMFPGSTPAPAFDRYAIPASAYSATYSSPSTGPSSYGLSQSASTSPRRLEDAYRQMTDYRTLAAAQRHRSSTLPRAEDVYNGASAAALSSLDHYYYSARDAMYRSQQLAAAAAMPHAFMTQSSAAPQYAERTATYGREAPSVYGQSASSYGLGGYPESQYLPSSTISGKSMTGANEYFASGVNYGSHSQDPYRHSVIYNMMPRYF